MCGIFGFVGKRARAESLDLALAIRSMHHRGPDDNGTYLGLSVADPGVACAFAHTRLSIIDLSPAGHQPMSTADGRFTIVYNGEVYNFREIRKTLEDQGVTFHSNCDTEVVLQAHIRWGAGCVDRFRGMFAFAVWDSVSGTLFLARDRFGIKPLYLVETAEGLGFSSELRTLLALGLAERKLCLDGLATYLRFGSIGEPFTVVRGVRSLPPAHTATWSGSLSQRRYWALASSKNEGKSFQQYALEVQDALDESVRLELVSDVPLGIFLSGGIDSSALTAVASAASEQPVHTFTVTFDEESYNEQNFAASVASRFGCDHHQVHLGVGRVRGEIESFLRALDQPSADGLNTYVVAQAAREAGLSVALSGLGGDEIFAGYPNFRSFAQYLRLGSMGRLLPWGSRSLIARAQASNAVGNRAKKLLAVINAGGNPEATYMALRTMFFDSQIARLAPGLGDYLQQPSLDEGRSATGDPISAYSRYEVENYLPNTLLRDTDAMSMAHSLEVRVPLIDHVLADLVTAIPGRMKMSRAVNKPLLVSGVRQPLPDEVVRRPKMGFVLPLETWFRGELRPVIESLLESDSEGSLPEVFDRAAVRQLWTSFLKGKRYVTYSRIWSLAALAGWCRENRITL